MRCTAMGSFTASRSTIRAVTVGTGLLLLCPAAAPGQVLASVAGGAGVPSLRKLPNLVDHVAASAPHDLTGLVTDNAGQPLAGVVVSALGATSVYAVSD